MTVENTDTYQDLAKGFGVLGQDTTLSTVIQPGFVVPDQQLAAYWTGDGLAKKIICAPVDDGLRAYFEIEGAEDTKPLSDELKQLKLKETLKLAFYWSRLYGGGLICIGYADGQNVDQPAIAGKQIAFLEVYPRTAVYLSSSDLDSNPASPRYGKAVQYNIMPSGLMTGSMIPWHHSRCIEVRGEPLPKDNLSVASGNLSTLYWGTSILQGLTQGVNTVGVALQGVSTLLRECSVGKYTLHGLNQMLAGPNGDSLVKRRLTTMQAAKSIINAVVLDAGSGSLGGAQVPAESYTRESVDFGGIPETMQMVVELGLAGPSNIPVSKLLGRQQTGMGSTDDASTRNYYDMVAEMQLMDIDPVALDIVKRVNAYTKTVADGKLALKWKSPWQPSEAQMVDLRNKQANTDKIYMDGGVVDSDEVRANRFEGETSLETHVEGPAPDIEIEPITPVPGRKPKASKHPKEAK